MTKQEFLDRLKESLENGLDSRAVRENIEYYNSYIDEETGHGRSEEEVLGELGDPWVIAQSVIGMAEQRENAEKIYGGNDTFAGDRAGRSGEQGYSDAQIHTYAVNRWWKILLFILGMVGIILIVFAVIGGLISLIMPFVMPVLIVVAVVRLMKRMR